MSRRTNANVVKAYICIITHKVNHTHHMVRSTAKSSSYSGFETDGIIVVVGQSGTAPCILL